MRTSNNMNAYRHRKKGLANVRFNTGVVRIGVICCAIAFLALLVCPLSSALDVVSPLDSVVVQREVHIEYLTSSSSCQAIVNGDLVSLLHCENFTIFAREGSNDVLLLDGADSQRITFTYMLPSQWISSGTGEETEEGYSPGDSDNTIANGRPATPPAIRTPRTPLSQSTTPEGVAIRGRTRYSIPSTILDNGRGPQETGTILGRSGNHKVRMEFLDNRIHSIELRDVRLPQTIDLGFEDLPLTVMTDAHGLDAFAIDPTRVNFTNGTITKTAIGNRVWKCQLWDFDNQTCTGDWALAMTLTPGQTYDIAFDAIDPAYVETFDQNPTNDISLASLDNTTIVIGYVESNGNASFQVWNTNGVKMVDKTVVDANGSAESRIDIEPINRTHFVVAVGDGPDDDMDFFFYDRNGNRARGETQVDPTTGNNVDNDVCQLGDRFAYVWADANDGDANYEIWWNNGTQQFNENQVDISIAPGALRQNLVSCSPLNNTMWAYAFYDDADNDASLAAVLNNGSIRVIATDLDINVGETGQIATAGLRNNRVAVAFYDSTDDDITMTIRGVTGAAFNIVLGVTDIDSNAGIDSRIAMTEIDNNGASNYVVAWVDTSDNTTKAAIYNDAGTQVTAPFNITTAPNTSGLLDVAGYSSSMGRGLCNGTFAVAYTNRSGTPVFETYHINGTRWDGVCGAPDNDEPIIYLTGPDNNITNTTSNRIDFLYNITDASDILNCSLIVDDIIFTTMENPARYVPLNFTVDLDNGAYTWAIECYDLNDNYNITETRNLTVDVPLLITGSEVRLAALDNNTLVIAYIDTGTNQAKIEVWDTDGTRLVNAMAIDTSVNANSRINAEPINSTHVGVAVIDGPEQDADFFIIDWQGNIVRNQIQVDPTTGINTDVGMCQLGDRFAYVWADANDGDANYEMWWNNGTQQFNENQVDTAITPGAIMQNLVSCSPLNNTMWAYAFYDDVDNDASLAAVLNTGTIRVIATDLDINVGETGQVATAGLRGDRVAVVFYDAVDQDITMTIRGVTGAAFNIILAVTDIDTGAGTDSRVAAAEVDNNGASNLVVAWQDTSDNTTKAAVYNDVGAQVTAPFNITTVPSQTSRLIDLAGFSSTLDIGLCNGTFAIAYTNNTGSTLFETYHINGTRWDGQCGNVPDMNLMTISQDIVLNAGTTKIVDCNFTIDDPDGVEYILYSNATLYHESSLSTDPIDNQSIYRNTTCSYTGSIGESHSFSCSFALQYFALNGTWTCLASVQDIYHHQGINMTNSTVDPLYAVNINTSTLDFGDLEINEISQNVSVDMINYGNQRINISVYGYGEQLGDGLAFICPSRNISVEYIRFAQNRTATYTQKRNLSSYPIDMNTFLLARKDNNETYAINQSYWQFNVPINHTYSGVCNGTIVFQAEWT